MKVLCAVCSILFLGVLAGCSDDKNSEAEAYIVPTDMPDGEAIINAVYGGDLETVNRIMTQNPDLINAQDPQGNTLLHMAAGSNRIGILTYLIEQGANKSSVNLNGLNSYEYADEESASAEVLALLE